MRIRTAIAGVVAGLTIALAGVTGASAASSSTSETATRAHDGIPSAVTYIHGTAEYVSPSVRCFIGRASRTVKIHGHSVTAGHHVGYCSDGYTDVHTSAGWVRI